MAEDPTERPAGFVPGRLVVTLSETALDHAREEIAIARGQRSAEMRSIGIGPIDDLINEFGGASIRAATRRRRFEHLVRVRLDRRLVIDFPKDADLDAIARTLEALPEVERVERDPELSTDQNVPDDPDYTNGTQWHLGQVSIEDAWNRSRGEGVIIGVYDGEGMRTGHPDLNANYVATDCTGDGDTPTGEHGTRVVGVCAAVTDNNLGVAGSGWNARFMALRAGGGVTGAAAIECMTDEGADLIVTSSPVKEDDQPSTLRDATSYAFESGVPIIASAGNAQKTIPYDQWPAANSRALAIGNTTNTDARSGTSNYGPWLDVMAPGTSIRTTSGANGYASPSGTSYSTPLVGGIVALMLARNRTIGPRQVYEILRQSTNLPAGTVTSDNRYGNGRVNAEKAMNATDALWKAVRYGTAPSIGAAVAISESGWWIAAYSKSVFVGFRNSFWRKRTFYDSIATARPAVAINERGDWIVNYSRSTFVGNGTGTVRKMVTYPRRTTPGAVAMNANGDWICVYSRSCFVGYRTISATKMVNYNAVPAVPGDVGINDRGDWICCYSKSTFVGFKTSTSSKMVTYNSVALAGASVGINAEGDWIVNYSRSTFVGFRRSASRKMVTYERRTTPGAVEINDRGDWITCYSKSTFVGFKRSSTSKMVTYSGVAPARPAVAINPNGDWIVNYRRSTFVGFRRQNSRKMVSYPQRQVAGDVAINPQGHWIATYSLSTFVGLRRSWSNKRLTYNAVPNTPAAVGINPGGDWIASYSRTTFLGNMLRSTFQAVRHAPDDMSKRDIENGASFPPSTVPAGPGSVGINRAGDWLVCYGRSTSVGRRALFTNTRRFD